MLLAPTPPRRWWRPSGTPTFKFPLTLTLKHPQHLTQNPTLLPYIPKFPFHTKYLPEALLLKRKHRAKKHERYNETKANAQIVLCHTCIMLKIQNSKTTPYKNHQKFLLNSVSLKFSYTSSMDIFGFSVVIVRLPYIFMSAIYLLSGKNMLTISLVRNGHFLLLKVLPPPIPPKSPDFYLFPQQKCYLCPGLILGSI